MVVKDQDVDTIISTIRAAGLTGKLGDGKIFVLRLKWRQRSELMKLGNEFLGKKSFLDKNFSPFCA